MTRDRQAGRSGGAVIVSISPNHNPFQSLLSPSSLLLSSNPTPLSQTLQNMSKISTKKPLPSTIGEKIAVATSLKTEGNSHFSAGDYKKAVQCYNKVFLYINGLHGNDSQMKGLMTAFGMGEMWNKKSTQTGEDEQSDKKRAKIGKSDITQGEGLDLDLEGGGNRGQNQCIMLPDSTAQDVVKALKIDVSSNLAFAYLKLDKFEKAEKSAKGALLLDASNAKAMYRLGLAKMGQEKVEEARDIILSSARMDPQNRAIRNSLEECKERIKAATLKRIKAATLKADSAFAGKML